MTDSHIWIHLEGVNRRRKIKNIKVEGGVESGKGTEGGGANYTC